MHIIDTSIVAFYLIATLVIGVYYGRQNKNLKDFAVGDRNFSTTLIFTSIFATFTGSNTILGWSQRIYTTGMIFAILTFGYGSYKLLVVRYIVPRLYQFKNCITVGDILSTRYGKFGRFFGGFFAFTKCAVSISGQITGLGLVITYFFNVDKYYSTALVTLVVILYSSYGGIKSVALTDLIQFLILIVAIPVVAAFTVYYAGGYEVVVEKALFSPSYSDKQTYTILSLFVLAIFSSFNPIILQRLLMSANLKNVGTAFKLSAFVNVPFMFIIALMAGGAYVLNDSGLDSKYATLYAIGKTLPIGLKGFVVAGLLAVMMSTIDSFINTASVIFTRDVYGTFFKNVNSTRVSLRIAQLTSLIVGVSAYIISMFFNNIFDVYLFSLVFWVPVILMPLYGVVFRYYSSQRTFILSGIVGLITFFGATQFFTIKPLCLISASAASALVFFHRGILNALLRIPTLSVSSLFLRNVGSFKKIFCLEVKKRKNNYLSFRHLEEVQMGFSIAAFLCFFAPYFVSFSTSVTVNIVRGLSTLLSLIYLLKTFYPFRWQQKLLENTHFFYFFCGIFAPILLYLLDPSQGALIVAVMFVVSSALIFSVQAFMASLMFTALVVWALPADSFFWETHEAMRGPFLVSAVLVLFFSGTFGVFARRGIQKRFNSLNALASGIAHELRTPLASVQLSSLKAEKELEEGKTVQVQEGLKKIQKIVKNTNETINISLYGLRMGAINTPLVPLKIKECLQHCVDIYPFDKKERALISTDFKLPEGLTVLGNDLLLKAILHNLIKNALEAIAEKGEDKKAEIKISAYKNQAHQVEVTVYDTGTGIPYALVSRIFDEQVTTKRNGSGIGLSFSHNAALYMYGDLYCYSEPGKWTEFVLKLPVSEREAEE